MLYISVVYLISCVGNLSNNKVRQHIISLLLANANRYPLLQIYTMKLDLLYN